MQNILIVVDMQNDFIDGSLGTKEAQAVLPKVKKKIQEFHGNVLFTRDTHEANYLETQEGKFLPVMHCIKNTKGWQIAEELLPYTQNAVIFDKSGFGSIELAGYLQEEDKKEAIKEIAFIGVCTDICVVSNALLCKAFLPDVCIKVDASCCAGVTPEKHEAALETMQSCQIQIV